MIWLYLKINAYIIHQTEIFTNDKHPVKNIIFATFLLSVNVIRVDAVQKQCLIVFFIKNKQSQLFKSLNYNICIHLKGRTCFHLKNLYSKTKSSISRLKKDNYRISLKIWTDLQIVNSDMPSSLIIPFTILIQAIDLYSLNLYVNNLTKKKIEESNSIPETHAIFTEIKNTDWKWC